MNCEEMENMLRQTLDDIRLSRGEKKALRQVLEDEALGIEERAWIRSRAFEMAGELFRRRQDVQVLEWLEQIVKLLDRPVDEAARAAPYAEACFTPGRQAVDRIAALFRTAQCSVDVCVFTITDNRIADAMLEAFRCGVALRVITDDDKANDLGSDVARLADAGVPVRTDRSSAHMHHKFALFDAHVLQMGSYNWTRGAAEENCENFIVIEHPHLIDMYSRVFEELWLRFG